MQNTLPSLDCAFTRVVCKIGQVIARLVRREDLYHSYATRVHGYILPSGTASDESNTLTLVHGVSFLQFASLA
jgi:hypothetical protein